MSKVFIPLAKTLMRLLLNPAAHGVKPCTCNVFGRFSFPKTLTKSPVVLFLLLIGGFIDFQR